MVNRQGQLESEQSRGSRIRVGSMRGPSRVSKRHRSVLAIKGFFFISVFLFFFWFFLLRREKLSTLSLSGDYRQFSPPRSPPSPPPHPVVFRRGKWHQKTDRNLVVSNLCFLLPKSFSKTTNLSFQIRKKNYFFPFCVLPFCCLFFMYG